MKKPHTSDLSRDSHRVLPRVGYTQVLGAVMLEQQRIELKALLATPDPPDLKGRGRRYRLGAKVPDRRSDLKIQLEQSWLLHRNATGYEGEIISVRRSHG